jgi:hypothetical protein
MIRRRCNANAAAARLTASCDECLSLLARTTLPTLSGLCAPNGARDGNIHRRLGVRSALVVPIRTRTNTIGALALAYSGSPRRHSLANIPAAQRRARQAALALQPAPVLDR